MILIASTCEKYRDSAYEPWWLQGGLTYGRSLDIRGIFSTSKKGTNSLLNPSYVVSALGWGYRIVATDRPRGSCMEQILTRNGLPSQSLGYTLMTRIKGSTLGFYPDMSVVLRRFCRADISG